jgi:hypothetical protein
MRRESALSGSSSLPSASILAALAFAAFLVVWFLWRRTHRVPCSLDLERTHEHLHAHLELMGFEVEPGDSVRITDAPSSLAYGEVKRIESEAVVTRASWLRRKWTRLVGRFEFYELYDVGFE